MLVKNITAEHVFLACGHTDMRKSIDGLMRKLLFASKSERTRIILPNPDQMSLFDELEWEASPESTEGAATVKAHKLRHTNARNSVRRRSFTFPRQNAMLSFWISRKRTVIALHVEVLNWFLSEKSMSAMRCVLSPQRLLLMKYTRMSTSAKPVKMMSMWNL